MEIDGRTGRATVGLLERGHPGLARLMDADVFADVSGQGYAHVPDVLSAGDRRRLLEGAEAVEHRFLALPDRVNGVQQRADQLTVRIGDPHHPSVNRLTGSVLDALSGWPAASGAGRFAPTEARYMRYTGSTAGLGAHRDGKCYRLLVCVFSLAGSARFAVMADGCGRAADMVVEPGDLLLLRAPGFAGDADGRRRHAVGPPLGDDRVSLTLRMVGATAPAADGWR